jgi:hypothetical protein
LPFSALPVRFCISLSLSLFFLPDYYCQSTTDLMSCQVCDNKYLHCWASDAWLQILHICNVWCKLMCIKISLCRCMLER